MQLPERQSLVSQTVSIIQQMIVEGSLVSPLMGERRLATKLQIGRDTLRSALKELESKQWISSGLHGKRRTILNPPELEVCEPNQKTVAVVSPKPIEQLPNHVLIELLY